MTIIKACVLFLALSGAAIAQESGEVGFHYAYNSVAVSNENGAAVYGEYFLRDRVGLIGEFGGSGSGSGSLYTYLFGIRLNREWKKSHLVLHADYKAGGARVRVNGAAVFVRNSFAWDIAGVGLDLRLGHHCVVTLIQTDFPAMEVPDFVSGAANWQSDMRISGGIGFRFDRAH